MRSRGKRGENFRRTVVHQLLRQHGAEFFGVRHFAGQRAANELNTVRRGDESGQRQICTIAHGVAAQRHFAATAEAFGKRPLGEHGKYGVLLRQRRE